MEKKIEELIDIYGTKNREYESLKKEVEGYKTDIKKYMTDNNFPELPGNQFIAQCRTSNTDKLDEDSMVEVLKNYLTKQGKDLSECPYIKTKLIVDMDELENGLFHKALPNEVMVDLDKCRTTTTKVSLYIKEKKNA